MRRRDDQYEFSARMAGIGIIAFIIVTLIANLCG